MKFQVVKRLKLDFLGEGWEKAYIDFNALTIRETQEYAEFAGLSVKSSAKEQLKATDKMLELLDSKFIKGKAFDGKTLVDIKKEDLLELPTSVVSKAVTTMTGDLSPNV